MLILNLTLTVFGRLVAYIQENEQDDPLVNPLANTENPFKPKPPCVIL